MLDDKDIQKLKESFATKDDLKNFATKDDLNEIKADLKNFATKDDFKDLKKDLISAMEKVFPTRVEVDQRFEGFRKDFSDLQSSVDVYAKKADTYFQEMVVINNNYKRLEGWVHQVAEKVGVELRY